MTDDDRTIRSVIPMLVDAKVVGDRDAVIARLLDGWTPVEGEWVRSRLSADEPYLAPMSDGEAAIIRAHLDRR